MGESVGVTAKTEPTIVCPVGNALNCSWSPSACLFLCKLLRTCARRRRGPEVNVGIFLSLNLELTISTRALGQGGLGGSPVLGYRHVLSRLDFLRVSGI